MSYRHIKETVKSSLSSSKKLHICILSFQHWLHSNTESFVLLLSNLIWIDQLFNGDLTFFLHFDSEWRGWNQTINFSFQFLKSLLLRCHLGCFGFVVYCSTGFDYKETNLLKNLLRKFVNLWLMYLVSYMGWGVTAFCTDGASRLSDDWELYGCLPFGSSSTELLLATLLVLLLIICTLLLNGFATKIIGLLSLVSSSFQLVQSKSPVPLVLMGWIFSLFISRWSIC